MTRYVCWRLIGVLFLAVMLAWPPSRAALAQQPKPVITTPTPQPTPTAVVPSPRQLAARATGGGSLTFMPLVATRSERTQPDVNPLSFAYTVKPGDTLLSLALDFGRDLETMACATTPTGAEVETLQPGQIIVIPALADLCYTVVPGDTLAVIAGRYGLTVDAIVEVPWNQFKLPPYFVRPRQRVLLPGVRPSASTRPDPRTVSVAEDSWALGEYSDWPFGDGRFIWPVSGPISQYAHDGHVALDIAVPIGTRVNAADRGTVVMAGWSAVGYGFRVVINHGNDYMTLYAHLSDIYVEVGQVVGKGQAIGLSGANGNVTGPHLHFELRDFGRLVDPLSLLP